MKTKLAQLIVVIRIYIKRGKYSVRQNYRAVKISGGEVFSRRNFKGKFTGGEIIGCKIFRG